MSLIRNAASDYCDGDLDIMGEGGVAVPLRGPAWWTFDLHLLWHDGAKRGADIGVPGADGVLAQPRRRTVTTHSLRMIFVGDVDLVGNPAIGDDTWWQLEENFGYVRDQIVAPETTNPGTRLATLTMPSGELRTAQVHVIDLVPGESVFADGAALMYAALELSIPLARFTP